MNNNFDYFRYIQFYINTPKDSPHKTWRYQLFHYPMEGMLSADMFELEPELEACFNE